MIKVASFLTESEMERIRNGLNGQRIQHFITSKGTASGEYHDPYFEVSVEEGDFVVAKKIVLKVKSAESRHEKQCPRCKQMDFKVIENTGFWQKVYYMGTTRVQCTKCGNRFVI